MRYFVEVGNQKTVRIQIGVERNAGTFVGLAGKITQPTAAGTHDAQLELMLFPQLNAIGESGCG